LPFAVDVNGDFVPSGYEGDAVGVAPNAGAIAMAADLTCGGNRSSATAMGDCHSVTYTPLAPGTPVGDPAGATTNGWAAVAWQHPANNWGSQPGYAIPSGATRVTFSARGAAGGEVVEFWIGGTATGSPPTPDTPCSDPIMASVQATLKKTWSTYTIALGGATYAPGVLTGFGFTVGASDQPASSHGGKATFYVDDIRWQM
jgi:hypothetical protein